MVVVGTKSDLRKDRVSLLRLDRIENQQPITVEKGERTAKRTSAVTYLECSAVSGVRIATKLQCEVHS